MIIVDWYGWFISLLNLETRCYCCSVCENDFEFSICLNDSYYSACFWVTVSISKWLITRMEWPPRALLLSLWGTLTLLLTRGISQPSQTDQLLLIHGTTWRLVCYCWWSGMSLLQLEFCLWEWLFVCLNLVGPEAPAVFNCVSFISSCTVED